MMKNIIALALTALTLTMAAPQPVSASDIGRANSYYFLNAATQAAAYSYNSRYAYPYNYGYTSPYANYGMPYGYANAYPNYPAYNYGYNCIVACAMTTPYTYTQTYFTGWGNTLPAAPVSRPIYFSPSTPYIDFSRYANPTYATQTYTVPRSTAVPGFTGAWRTVTNPEAYTPSNTRWNDSGSGYVAPYVPSNTSWQDSGTTPAVPAYVPSNSNWSDSGFARSYTPSNTTWADSGAVVSNATWSDTGR